jgi:large conductance mechanosensitive channel
MFKDFKEFVTRGNVLDLAIGIIMGAAFVAIVNSLVKDVIMPPIGLLLGKIDFNALYINLSGKRYASLTEARAAGAPVIAYGIFLNSVISFLIVAFVVFLIVRAVNRLRREQPAAPMTRKCPFCLEAVDVAATRCPHCTSELPPVEEPEPGPPQPA